MKKKVKYHSHIVLLPLLLFLYFCTQIMKLLTAIFFSRWYFVNLANWWEKIVDFIGIFCQYVRPHHQAHYWCIWIKKKNMWVRDITPECNYAQFEILLFMIHILIYMWPTRQLFSSIITLNIPIINILFILI